MAFRLSFRCFQSDLFIGFRAAKIARFIQNAFFLQNSSARRSERKFAKRVEAVRDSKVG